MDISFLPGSNTRAYSYHLIDDSNSLSFTKMLAEHIEREGFTGVTYSQVEGTKHACYRIDHDEGYFTVNNLKDVYPSKNGLYFLSKDIWDFVSERDNINQGKPYAAFRVQVEEP